MTYGLMELLLKLQQDFFYIHRQDYIEICMKEKRTRIAKTNNS